MKNKVFRFLSIVLTICMIFSVCNIALYAQAESVTRVYYVKTDGLSENDGLTSDTPLPTVAEVIAKCGDMVAGDNIIVNVMGDSVQTGTLGTYAATLTVQSADSQVKTKVYGVASPYINGPTVFKNVVLATAEGQATRFYFNGHDVTLESDVEISNIDHVASNTYSSNSTIPGQTMVFNNAITSTQKFFLPNIGHCNGTKYTEDFNLIINNASATPLVTINAKRITTTL